LELPWTTGVTLSQMPNKIVALRRDHKFGPVNIGTYLFDSGIPAPVHFEIMPLLMRLWRVPPAKQLALVGNRGPSED
jgi:hypothetical protein